MRKGKKKKGNKDNDAILNLKFAVLAPFKRAMKTILKARGVKPKSDKLKDIAAAFVTHIVSKNHFEKQDFERQVESFEQENLVEEAIDIAIAIIKKVVQYFKDKKADQAAGVPLDPDVQKAVGEAESDVESETGLSDSTGGPKATVGGHRGDGATQASNNAYVAQKAVEKYQNDAAAAVSGRDGYVAPTTTTTTNGTTPTAPKEDGESPGIFGILVAVVLVIVVVKFVL